MIVIVLPEDKSSFCNSELKNVPFNFGKDNTCISITQIEKGFGVFQKMSYQSSNKNSHVLYKLLIWHFLP